MIMTSGMIASGLGNVRRREADMHDPFSSSAQAEPTLISTLQITLFTSAKNLQENAVA